MFRLRPPTADDAAAVLRVLQARDIADFGAPDFTLEDLLDQWRSSEFDLEADALIAVDRTGEVIGYATLWNPGVLSVVDPAREGEGIGSALLRWTESRARQLGRSAHRQWVAERNATGHDLLTRAGYRPVRSYWRFACELDGRRRAPPLPEGVTLALVDRERDARPLHAISEATFASNPDYEPESLVAFRDTHLAGHDFDARLSRVARRSSDVVGFVLCRRWAQEHVGFVDLLGVHPSEGGCGLGSSLLLTAFEAFAAAGLHEAQLGVASDNPHALALYDRVGMTPRHRVDVLERPA